MTSRPVVRRFVLVALVLPAIVVALGVIAQVLALPGLPDPVAVHWGASGAPDGFGPAWLSLLLTVAVGLGLPALMAAMSLPALRRGDHGAAYRLMGAVALALAVLMTVLGTWTLLMQVGIDDAAAGPSVFVPLLVAGAAAIGAGFAGWAIQPDEPWRATTPDPAAPLPLAPTERAVWLQRTAIAPAGAVILVIAAFVMVAGTVVTLLASPEPIATWVMMGATVLVVGLVITTVVFHVRVDDDGLSVASAVGWPSLRVPLTDVVSAAAVEVNPMAEFGGWGMRWSPGGRFGVVLRTGPGIEVRRRSGKTFTVTVDDAETGAALLNALVARAAAGDGPATDRSATERTAGDR